MFLPEEKLSVEITQIDCIEVDDVDLAEASEDKVLQQFTANASSTNHQDSGLLNTSVRHGVSWGDATCDLAVEKSRKVKRM